MASSHPPLEKFQIGWICALPIELAAAAAMLDEEYGLPNSQDAADSNTYTLGRIGEHNIVIACLPAKQIGKTSAATVANNMVRTFPTSLRVGLMVGVGGGIPSAAHDIRLGDIVISCPGNTEGGVVQYDMGKICAGGKFHRTGSLNSPPKSLLTAVNVMQAKELRKGPDFPSYLTEAITRTERTRENFGRPSTSLDRLFKPEHDHPGSASRCDGCLAEWEETRDERQTSDPQPHYGIIASGDAVIEHGLTREQLRLETGALCVEMEAAGLMMDFPCLVIRGICDYADSHKNKRWQGYAALAAASYAKELLQYMTVGLVTQERLVMDVCTALRVEIQGVNQRLDRAYDQHEKQHCENIKIALTEKQQQCHQTFKVSNYTEQKNINPPKIEGTCQWALKSPEYTRWLEGSCNGLLWVSADPGCGKSVFARSIVDDIGASRPELTTCYFFFKDNDEQNRLAVALCAVLHQLFSQRPDLLEHATPCWERNGEKLRQDTEELWRILVATTSSKPPCKTICVIDALDECREIDQRRLIEKLEFLHRCKTKSSSQDSWLKFLVTSRPYDQIQQRFYRITRHFPHVHLKGEEENDTIHEEINLVVKLRVDELATTLRLLPETQQRIETKLLSMQNRTYLWLHLAIDDIRETFANSLWPAEESIQLLPSSVDAAYEKILIRVPPNSKKTVKKIFEFLIAAQRPLTVSEMEMALGVALRPQCQTPSHAGLDELGFGGKLRRLCGLFIFIKNSKIHFVHETAKEFLLVKLSEVSSIPSDDCWQHSITPQDAHKALAIVCVKYLDSLNRDKTKIILVNETADADYKKPYYSSPSHALLVYAANHWGHHFSLAEFSSDDNILSSALRICDPRSAAFGTWWIIHKEGIVWSCSHLDSYSEWDGFRDCIEDMLKINAHAGSPFVNPLCVEALDRHATIVKILLEDDTSANPRMGGLPFALAAVNGDWRLVEMLLDHGAYIKLHALFGMTPLSIVAREGHAAAVKFLIERGVNTEPEGLQSPVLFAARAGHEAVIDVLLDMGLHVESAHYGQTSLSWAAENGRVNLVRLLIEKWRANPDSKDSNGRTPLSLASGNGHTDVVQLLLSINAVDPDSRDYGRKHLRREAKGAYHQIAAILRNRGSKVVPKSIGRTPLSYAAESLKAEVVELLLGTERVDPNSRDSYGLTPLSYARGWGSSRTRDLLLSKGARDAN
ncbi:hypothetical protein BDV19DRAFT_386724 [Aspergillus venezuelensis]